MDQLDQSTGGMEDLKVYSHQVFTDITDELKSVAADLEPGKVLTDPFFKLMDGSHALEIGHDKMDTGLAFQPLQKQLASLPVIDSEQKFLVLCDLLVGREMSWHSGKMLIQSILSSLHVEKFLTRVSKFSKQKPEIENYIKEMSSSVGSWEDAATAYVVGISKCVDLCIKAFEVSNAAVFAEEDIVVNRCDFDFISGCDLQHVATLVRAASTWCQRQGAKSAKMRLDLRTELIYVFGQKLTKNANHLAAAKSLLQQISPVEGEDEAALFSKAIQGRVSNVFPVRPLSTVPVPDAYKMLQTIIEHISEVSNDLKNKESALDLLSFFVTFSGKRSPAPLPITRSLLCGSIRKDINGQPFKTWAVKDMMELTCCSYGNVLHSTNTKCKQLVDPIIANNATPLYADLLTVMCQNRPRQRQNLLHLVPEWDNLQVMAEQMEENLNSSGIIPRELIESINLGPGKGTLPAFPFSSWVFFHKLQIMIWAILMGFELDIYKEWEFSRMYYILDLLMEDLQKLMERIRTYLSQISTSDKSAKVKTQAKRAHAYVEALLLEFVTLNQLCKANMYLSLAYEAENYISCPASFTNDFTTPELLYLLRMKSFCTIGVPQLPDYNAWTQFRSQIITDEDGTQSSKLALQLANHMSNNCKNVLAKYHKVCRPNSEIDLLKRSAVGISVSSLMLAKDNCESRVSIKREGYHWFFPVLTLTKPEVKSERK